MNKTFSVNKDSNSSINQSLKQFNDHFSKRSHLLIAALGALVVAIGILSILLNQKKDKPFEWNHFTWAECNQRTDLFNQKFELAIPKLNKVRVTFFTERKNHVDGYGYECSKLRVTTKYITKYYKSETNTDIVQLTRNECYQMKETKMCDGKRMRCNKHVCYSNFEEEINGWFSTTFIRHTCSIYQKRIVKKYLDDVVYYDGISMCKVLDYECRTNNSIWVWNTDVIQDCPYGPIKSKVYETVYLNRKHYLHSIDDRKEVHEIVGQVQLCNKTFYKTKYGQYFVFNKFVENERLAKLNTYAKFFTSVIQKKLFSIDGYGVECTKIRMDYIKYFYIFIISNVAFDFVHVSKDECWDMINSNMCDGHKMTCNGPSNCSLEYGTQEDEWFSSRITKYICRINTVHIVARNRNDLLFTNYDKPCQVSNYECRSNQSLVVWRDDIIDNCPFEFVKTTIAEKIFIQNKILFQLMENQKTTYYEIVDVVRPCGDKWYMSKEGYYFSFAEDDVLEFQGQTDILVVNKIASDFIGNKKEVYRLFGNALCHHQLRLIESFSNEHVKFLFNHKSSYFYLFYHYPVKFYASNDILINRINLLHSLNESDECMSIEFTHKKISHMVFLKSSQMSKFTSKMYHLATDQNNLQMYNSKNRIDQRSRNTYLTGKTDHILNMMYYATIANDSVF